MTKRIVTVINLRPMRIVLGVALILLSGCNPFHGEPKLAEPVTLVAVKPFEPLQPAGAPATAAAGSVPAEAANRVTAAVYAVLRKDPERHIVPDIIVSQVMRRLHSAGNLSARARALGKELKADAVLFGTVSRYVEREGTESEARRPAAVGFELRLISVRSGAILWSGSFEQTQPPPSSTPDHWWQSSSGEPHWLTAQELTRIGAEQVLKDLEPRLR